MANPLKIFPEYTIGDFINQPGNPTQFEITRFETMAEPEVEDVHKHTFYEILWVDAGTSVQHIDYKQYDLRKGSLFLISPGQLHKFEEWQPLKGGTIMFTPEFYLIAQEASTLFSISYLDHKYEDPVLTPTSVEFVEIRNTIDLLLSEQSRPDRRLPILQSLLHILIQQIQRSYESKKSTSVQDSYLVTFRNYKQLIEKNYSEPYGVKFYADHLHITSHHLNRICRAVVNKTATSLIQERKLIEVQRMLTFTELNIGEIAAALGMFDSSYLAKVFRRNFQMSPIEFRAKMSEKYRRS